jgi:hypothetical protein
MSSALKPQAKRIKANVVANLFEVHIPLVVLLSRKVGKNVQHYIACAILDDTDIVSYYFAVFVGRYHLKRYFNGQCDLRYLFAFASGRKYYKILNIDEDQKEGVFMEEFTGDLVDSLMPDSRFFATSHTSEYGIEDDFGIDQQLYIDGYWDMQEFGAFYQKFSDLYSLNKAISYYEDSNQSKISEVEKAFASKPFRGGSSYMGFFNDLFEIMPTRERPSLKGIEYHSPGYVELRGNDVVMEAVKHSVNCFLSNVDEIQKQHDNLRSFMSKRKLLSITGSLKDVKPDTLHDLRILADNFYDVMPIEGKVEIKTLTKGDPIVYAKVGLAIFRRLQATSSFFAQGRLTYAS